MSGQSPGSVTSVAGAAPCLLSTAGVPDARRCDTDCRVPTEGDGTAQNPRIMYDACHNHMCAMLTNEVPSWEIILREAAGLVAVLSR